MIGQLLYDSALSTVKSPLSKASKNRVADRLTSRCSPPTQKVEREQGITIDVAYRYFATAKRVHLADTPGRLHSTQHGHQRLDHRRRRAAGHARNTQSRRHAASAALASTISSGHQPDGHPLRSRGVEQIVDDFDELLRGERIDSDQRARRR